MVCRSLASRVQYQFSEEANMIWIRAMADKLPLYVLFTMNCEPPKSRTAKSGPETWEMSARSIEGFCIRLGRAGYRPTLFSSLACVEEQTPLLEDIIRRGGEIGLFLHPPQIGDGRFKHYLGQYSADDQRSLIDHHAERFADNLGSRPHSFRGGHFSANNDTFRVLFDLGFRQGSLSEPGRVLPKREAVWQNAPIDPHYVDSANKLAAGGLLFLELPVTTDPEMEIAQGVPYTLQIEAGTLEAFHRPILQAYFERMDKQPAPFLNLVFYTCNSIDYYDEENQHARTLELILDELALLADRFTIMPVTMFQAHEFYRRAISKSI